MLLAKHTSIKTQNKRNSHTGDGKLPREEVMKRIYVAGPYSADNVLDVLRNIGRGEDICTRLFDLGFAPYDPWHDRKYVMNNPNGNFTVHKFQDNSMEWLEVSDAVLLVEGWESSKGTLVEIERAKELGIPVFYNVYELLVWAKGA